MTQNADSVPMLYVDTSDIDPEATITIPLWRWHVLTCHSARLRALWLEGATQNDG